MTSAAEQTATKREWRNDALCLQFPPEMFFPEQGPTGARAAREARSVCAACPVISDCLDDAIRTREVNGIRAGLTEYGMRKAIAARGLPMPRYQPSLAECGTPAAYRRHIRNDEPVCEACRSAEARRFRNRKKAA